MLSWIVWIIALEIWRASSVIEVGGASWCLTPEDGPAIGSASPATDEDWFLDEDWPGPEVEDVDLDELDAGADFDLTVTDVDVEDLEAGVDEDFVGAADVETFETDTAGTDDDFEDEDERAVSSSRERSSNTCYEY